MHIRTIFAAISLLALGAADSRAADISVTFGKSNEGSLPTANASCIAADGKAVAGRIRSPALSWSTGSAACRCSSAPT